MYVENATATIKNTIAWGNLVNGLNTELGQIHKWSFSTFGLWFSCVQNWTSGGLGGSYNTASDPLLADPDGVDNALGTADDDVRLTSGSSAIDTASDAAVPDDTFDVDRDGDADEPLPLDLGRGNRFLGTGPTVDMGAYEYLNPGDGLGDPEPPAAGSPAPEPSGTAYIAFTYDALGRRIERTIDSGGAGVEVTRYYYEGQNVILETDADEAPRRTYVHGSQYIDERVLVRLPTGKEYYYLPRELYSVAALTDETGAIVEAATYDTYGQVTVYDGSAQAVDVSPVGNPYYFTGRRLDLLPTAHSPQPISKQLYHYRARAYDPENGLYGQRHDPGELSANTYVFAKSGPVTLADPSGSQPVRQVDTHRPRNPGPMRLLHFEPVAMAAGCNPDTGKPITRGRPALCASDCERRHENIHAADQSSCCKRLKKCIDNGHGSLAECMGRWNDWMEGNDAYFECRAYRDTVACLRDFVFWRCQCGFAHPSAACCSQLNDTALPKAKGLRDRNCGRPGAGRRYRCPFDGEGQIREGVLIGELPPERH